MQVMLHTSGNEVYSYDDGEYTIVTSQELNPADCKLVVSLIDKSNSEFIAIKSIDNPSQSFDLSLDTSTLALGEYALEARLIDKSTNTELDRNIHTIRRITGFSGFSSYIDENGRYIKDGEAEFYTFIYLGNDNEGDLDEIAEGNFDGVMRYDNRDGTGENALKPYGDSFFDLTSGSGFGVLANTGIFKGDYNFSYDAISSNEGEIISGWTNYLKEKDNLDLYYVGDEENPVIRDRIRWRSDIMSELDIDTPTVYVDNNNKSNTIFANNQNADIMALDNYTIKNEGTNEFSWVGEWTRRLKANFVNKPIWMIHQCANYDEIYGNTSTASSSPTDMQMMNIAMQSIVNGATGIGWYSYNDIKETETNGREPDYSASAQLTKLCNVNSELEAISNIIMSIEEVPDLQFDVSLYDGSKNDHIEYMVRKYNGKIYVFLVQNGRCTAPSTVSIAVSNLTAGDFKINKGECSYEQSGDVITVTMPKEGVCVIELN